MITGFNPGFLKVSCTKTLQTTGLALKEAKAATDAILRREAQQISVSNANAQEFLTALCELGAIANLVNNDNGNV